ncbi:hypothetical protein MPSEU_000980100 [Mayamaea pseudoterrestris]|nr:hypothetical protein MPSEU_000980100 [Mayamaea pseudoterrestris]
MFFFRGKDNQRKSNKAAHRNGRRFFSNNSTAVPSGGPPIVQNNSNTTANSDQDVVDDDLEQLRESPIAMAWMQHREKYHQQQEFLRKQQQSPQHAPLSLLLPSPPARTDQSSTDTLPSRLSHNSNDAICHSPKTAESGSDNASHNSGSLASDFTPIVTNGAYQQRQQQAGDDSSTLASNEQLSVQQPQLLEEGEEYDDADKAVVDAEDGHETVESSSSSSNSPTTIPHEPMVAAAAGTADASDTPQPSLLPSRSGDTSSSGSSSTDIVSHAAVASAGSSSLQHATLRKSNRRGYLSTSNVSNKTKALNSDNDDRRRPWWCCRSTKHLLLCLLLLLLLAIGIIVASVYASRRNNKTQTEPSSSKSAPFGNANDSGLEQAGDNGSSGNASDSGSEQAGDNGTSGNGDNTGIGNATQTDSGDRNQASNNTVVQLPPVDMTTNEPTAAPTVRSTPLPTNGPTFTANAASLVETSTTKMVQGRAAREAFGAGLAISGDGTVMAVGAPKASVQLMDATSTTGTTVQDYAGIVSVYRLSQTAINATSSTDRWEQQGDLLLGSASSDYFGTAVAMNYDGSMIVVGEPGHDGNGDRSGQVRAFITAGTDENGVAVYKQFGQSLVGSVATACFGSAVAASQNGYRIAVGAPYYSGDMTMQGQVSVYEFINGQWQILGEPLIGLGQFDWLGTAIDLSPDGSVLVASAPHDSSNNGYVLAWQWDGSTWNQLGGNGMVNSLSPATSSDRFGQSVSISENGVNSYRVAIGVPSKQVGDISSAGVVLVYEYSIDEFKWKRIADPVYNAVQGEEFGSSVKLASYGANLVIGAPGYNMRVGSVSFFFIDSITDLWVKSQPDVKGTNALDEFGSSIAIAGSQINGQEMSVAIGAAAEKSTQPGYVLSWTQQSVR